MPWVKAIQEILQPADLLYLYHLFVSEIWPFKDHQRDHINFQWKSQNERVHKFYSSALVFAGTVKFFPTFPRGTFIPWQHQMHWCLSKLLEKNDIRDVGSIADLVLVLLVYLVHLYPLVPDFNWFYRIVPGCTWLYLVAPGCNWLHLVAPG